MHTKHRDSGRKEFARKKLQENKEEKWVAFRGKTDHRTLQ